MSLNGKDWTVLENLVKFGSIGSKGPMYVRMDQIGSNWVTLNQIESAWVSLGVLLGDIVLKGWKIDQTGSNVVNHGQILYDLVLFCQTKTIGPILVRLVQIESSLIPLNKAASA